ncbi:phytanoyl-CoA dioxygenase family protein [Marinobacter sp. 2_MG-2023]|uniref:phytanoyl-CoA dioxygenase family protein n=1 Tax=Marinobacter sp. 2_MG-2023 TaxID=3062679 RepID=UPI0026E44B66|nr:phytanoyl-CoA dioxygenase family protein [Marinobacter sp. 2_MG-2023]MDO6441688.1 phytanoyl-CoA dioxygenase family protein [Marinobacter sp. 2_MG-2023]
MPDKKKIESVLELTEDLAATHKSFRSDESSSEALKNQIAQDFETVMRNGYVIIEKLLSVSQLDLIRDATLPLLGKAGRNTFEGVKTQRLYNVLEKTRVIDLLATHPRITGLLDRLFQPNYLLSQAQIINILSGESAQPLHYDDGFYPVPRPRPPFGAATVWAIDEFTEDNGATVVIPESHNLGKEVITDRSQAIPAVMPAGSVVFFLGTLWHGGGANRSDADRLAVTCQYCEPWLRPQENFFLELSQSTLSQIPEQLLSMVGYSIHPPFMGMVDGMHPKRTLQPIKPE